jgi:hypothetical protein
VEDVIVGKMFPTIEDWEGSRTDTNIKEFAFPCEIAQSKKKLGESATAKLYVAVPEEFLKIYQDEELLKFGTTGLYITKWK